MSETQQPTEASVHATPPARYEDEIDLITFLEVVIRRRRLIILGTILFSVGTAIFSHLYQPSKIFSAEANLICKARGCLDTRVSVFRRPFESP